MEILVKDTSGKDVKVSTGQYFDIDGAVFKVESISIQGQSIKFTAQPASPEQAKVYMDGKNVNVPKLKPGPEPTGNGGVKPGSTGSGGK